MVYVFAQKNRLNIAWGSKVGAPSPARWEQRLPRARAAK